jgi:uncharacterized spore protein YtfJ
MDVQEMVSSAREALTVKRVFGEPYERDGVTLIPAARVAGGGGGGQGEGPNGDGKGSGGGFGLGAKPVGAYVIRDGVVAWQPAIDMTRVIIGAQVSGVIALLIVRSMLKTRGKRKLGKAKLRAKHAD